jgi:hypothetical protein
VKLPLESLVATGALGQPENHSTPELLKLSNNLRMRFNALYRSATVF